jgi:hypothetical protein
VRARKIGELDASSHTAGDPCPWRARLFCSTLSSRQEEEEEAEEEKWKEDEEELKEEEGEEGEVEDNEV